MRRSMLDLQAQIETMRREMAQLTGAKEQLEREVAELQRAPKRFGSRHGRPPAQV